MPRFQKALLLPIAAALATLASAPAAAQRTGAQVDVMNAALAGTLAVCTGVVAGTFDLNDTAALAQYAFVDGAAADEAHVRERNPGAELAVATLAEGRVLIAGKPRSLCLVEVQGQHRGAARDELVQELLDTGARNDAHVAENGDNVRTFHFSTHTIEIKSGTSGAVNILVKGPGY